MVDYEAKRQRLMNWKPPGSEPAGLMTMVLRGGPLHAGAALQSLIPAAMGPTPALDEPAHSIVSAGGVAVVGAALKPARAKATTHKPAEPDSKRRRRMVAAFVGILLLTGSVAASELAAQVAEASEIEAYELTSLTLEGKRTATLACRLSSLTAYLASYWRVIWPPTKESTYSFFRTWASEAEAASRAPRFLEALRFLGGLGFDLCQRCLVDDHLHHRAEPLGLQCERRRRQRRGAAVDEPG